MALVPLSLFSKKQAPSLGALCGRCRLDQQCQSPKMPPSGQGKKDILIVGEAGGKLEDEQGKQFVGPSGELLRKLLLKCGIDMRADCRITNALSCFTGDVPIQSPSPVQKAYRRSYLGPLVRINTLSGRVITGTPNHPTLTFGGWVPLGLLKEGDNLICCELAQRSGFGRANVNDPPTSFKEAFRSFQEFGHIQRMVGRRMDFHGDGSNSDVDVVTVDSSLRQRRQASVTKHGNKIKLVSTYKSSRPLFSFGRGGDDPDVFRSESLSASGCGMCRFSQSQTAFDAGAFQSQNHRLALGSDVNAESFKDGAYPTISDAEFPTKTLQSLPGKVTLDQVVKVEWKRSDQLLNRDNGADGSCRVYNIQTRDGYYTADGIVVSNCHPAGNVIKEQKAVEWCRPLVLQEIERSDPNVIILLGKNAVKSVIGHMWKEDTKGVMRWAGFQIPNRRPNVWICPTIHPAHVLRQKDKREGYKDRGLTEEYLLLHLRQAVALAKSKPWQEVPDYETQVRVVYDLHEAAVTVDQMVRKGTPVAVDFETDRLKPDHPDRKIVCCAVSDGETTICYPWLEPARSATGRLLKSGVPLIASNMQFENGWTLREFGHPAVGFESGWDTMLQAHVLDNRAGITSIKFQAYLWLGQEDYDGHLKQFLKSKNSGGYETNRVREIDRDDLYKYCGMDALLEWLVAHKQAERLEMEIGEER